MLASTCLIHQSGRIAARLHQKLQSSGSTDFKSFDWTKYAFENDGSQINYKQIKKFKR